MTTARMSTGRPSSSSQAATWAKSSPARSATVLSMWAPVSNRNPPPDSSGCWRHVPSVSVAQSCQTTALMLRIGPSSPERSSRDGLADLRRQAALERDDEQPPGPIAGLDQRARLVRGHHHRLLEQDVEAGLEAGRRLGEVEGVRRDDDDGVELDRRTSRRTVCQSGSLGGDRQPVLVEQLGGGRVRGGDGSQTATTSRVRAPDASRRGGSGPSRPCR